MPVFSVDVLPVLADLGVIRCQKINNGKWRCTVDLGNFIRTRITKLVYFSDRINNPLLQFFSNKNLYQICDLIYTNPRFFILIAHETYLLQIGLLCITNLSLEIILNIFWNKLVKIKLNCFSRYSL